MVEVVTHVIAHVTVIPTNDTTRLGCSKALLIDSNVYLWSSHCVAPLDETKSSAQMREIQVHLRMDTSVLASA